MSWNVGSGAPMPDDFMRILEDSEYSSESDDHMEEDGDDMSTMGLQGEDSDLDIYDHMEEDDDEATTMGLQGENSNREIYVDDRIFDEEGVLDGAQPVSDDHHHDVAETALENPSVLASPQNYNIDEMPFCLVDANDFEFGSLKELSKSPLPMERPAKRVRSESISPPPYSPLTSPRNRSIERVSFMENMLEVEVEVEIESLPIEVNVEAEPVELADIEPNQVSERGRMNVVRMGRGAGRTNRGQPGRRGRGRIAHAHNGRGRGQRSAFNAVLGERRWKIGDNLIEVCQNDADIPPNLKIKIDEGEKRATLRCNRERRRVERNVGVPDESDEEDTWYHGDASARVFKWESMPSYIGQQEIFTEIPGPIGNYSTPYEAFRKYWDDAILNHIVTETNRYAKKCASSSQRFARDWYDTNVHEILILFAFWMMLGIIRMPSIKSCFSNNPLIKTSVFSKLMTQSRYWLLNKALHFVDDSTRGRDSSKLFLLGPLIDHFNRKFMEVYTPGRDIAIDESLTLWKGNLSFKQYIKTKSARFGIKSFELCESSTGYMWSFFIYVGKDLHSSGSSKIQKSAETVVKLIKPLLNKGYRLHIDNWFNSPLLARFLKRNKTDCIGTLRKSRKNIPELIKLASLPEGHFICRHSGDVVVMVYQDKKPIYVLSTCHDNGQILFPTRPGKPSRYKPKIIASYNKGMGGVDRKDQMLEPYLVERKRCRKWYKKMFKRLLNVSIFNSQIILAKSSGNEMEQISFRLKLVEQIMNIHLPCVPKSRVRPVSNKTSLLPLGRIVPGSHFIVRADTDDIKTGANRTSKNRSYCIWCTVREKRYRKTVYTCEQCEVPLCIGSCFKNFHTIS